MGAYFQYVCLDRKEVISLSSVANIKGGAYTQWGLQTAILQVFLGGPRGRDYNPGNDDLWSIKLNPLPLGLWQGLRVAIECDDYGPNWTRKSDVDWPDVGMLFLLWLREKGILVQWLKARDLYGDDKRAEYMWAQLDKWLYENSEQLERTHWTGPLTLAAPPVLLLPSGDGE